jgi:hypothetical protein
MLGIFIVLRNTLRVNQIEAELHREITQDEMMLISYLVYNTNYTNAQIGNEIYEIEEREVA